MTSSMAFAAAFIFLVTLAVLSDLSRLKIPNWISLALVALFFAFSATGSDPSSVLLHMLVAAMVFAGGFAMFAAGWMGAGDVKLLTAVTLWAGPGKVVALLFITSLTGAALAITILAGTFYLDWDGSGRAPTLVSRMFPRWVRRGLTPYGFAIGMGALLTVPSIIL
jgi:prepilin peptidase CpaA